MTDRKRKSDGLKYGMRPNPGARQPSGLAPDVVEFLRHEGGFADDPPVAPPVPILVEPDAAPAPRTVTPAAPATRPRRSTGKRTSSRKADAYALPPSRKRQPSRSNHFRLPADVEEHLKELAKVYDCSRTHVVCSVILSEW